MIVEVANFVVESLLVPNRLIAFDFRGGVRRIGVVIEYDWHGCEPAEVNKLGHLVSVYVSADDDELFLEVLERNSDKGTRHALHISPEKFRYCQDFLRNGGALSPRRVFREFCKLFPDAMKAYLGK